MADDPRYPVNQQVHLIIADPNQESRFSQVQADPPHIIPDVQTSNGTYVDYSYQSGPGSIYGDGGKLFTTYPPSGQVTTLTFTPAQDEYGWGDPNVFPERVGDGYLTYSEKFTIHTNQNVNGLIGEPGQTFIYGYFGQGKMASVPGNVALGTNMPPEDSPLWRDVIIARQIIQIGPDPNNVDFGEVVYIFLDGNLPPPVLPLDARAPINNGGPAPNVVDQLFNPNNYKQNVYIKHTSNKFAFCFAGGTRIATAKGECDVAELAIGDQILTKDNGYQPIRWIGKTIVPVAEQLANPQRRPIRIAAGALAPSVPATDLLVSHQHRMLLAGEAIATATGHSEVLVPAKDLLELAGVTREAATGEVVYYHMLLGQHEVIYAHGAETESFYPGPTSMRMLAPHQRLAVMEVLPEVRQPDHSPAAARQIVSGRKARELAQLHARSLQTSVAAR